MAKPKPSEDSIVFEAVKPGATFVALGKQWGVTAKTAKVWCKTAGIEKPGVQPIKTELVQDLEPIATPVRSERRELTAAEQEAFGTIGHLIKTKQPQVFEKIENLPVSAEKELYALIDSLSTTVIQLKGELVAERKARLHFKDDLTARVEEIFRQVAEP